MSYRPEDEIEKLRRLIAQVGFQGEDFQLFEWMYDVKDAAPTGLDLSQGCWVVELLPPHAAWAHHGRPDLRYGDVKVFLSPHLARQRLAEIVTKHGGPSSTIDDGIAVHVIMLDDYEARLSYWGRSQYTPDGQLLRINIHRNPKGGVGPRPRPQVLPQSWYESIPFELILFGPWMPYLFLLAVLAVFYLWAV